MKVEVNLKLVIEVDDEYAESDVQTAFHGMGEFEEVVKDFLEEQYIEVISVRNEG